MALVQMFYQGDKVFNIVKKKSGKIINLRNDSREKKMRELNPSHYYYHIDYDDESFDTYVFGGNLIKCPKTKIELPVYYDYKPGQRFVNTRTNKNGTIKYLRDDEYEKNKRISNPTHYYYHVYYDDGSFETYEYGKYLNPI